MAENRCVLCCFALETRSGSDRGTYGETVSDSGGIPGDFAVLAFERNASSGTVERAGQRGHFPGARQRRPSAGVDGHPPGDRPRHDWSGGRGEGNLLSEECRCGEPELVYGGAGGVDAGGTAENFRYAR